MFFSRTNTRYGAQDGILLRDFLAVDPKAIAVTAEPFPHVIIQNLFTPEYYEQLCDAYLRIKNRGLNSTADYRANQFHAFDIAYEGYTHSPTPTLDPDNPLRLLFSVAWNRFFSGLFNEPISLETKLAFHHHPAGNQPGRAHHDFIEHADADAQSLPNGVIAFKPRTSISPSYGRPHSSLTGRSFQTISVLFYLLNDDWFPGDGGETGLYGPDGKTLFKKVPPTNNSLLAFQTSHRSMHRFLGNRKDRNSFVQFFHTSPERILVR